MLFLLFKKKSTLSPNSGGGTDHGWSGTSFALGGGIKGGRILGQYPNDFTVHNPLNVGKLGQEYIEVLVLILVLMLLSNTPPQFPYEQEGVG